MRKTLAAVAVAAVLGMDVEAGFMDSYSQISQLLGGGQTQGQQDNRQSTNRRDGGQAYQDDPSLYAENARQLDPDPKATIQGGAKYTCADYTVAYPGSWSLERGDTSASVNLKHKKTPTKDAKLFIKRMILNGSDIDKFSVEYKAAMRKGFPSCVISQDTACKIGGVKSKAFKIQLKGERKVKSDVRLVPYDDAIYIISFVAENDSYSALKDDVDSIVGSLRFKAPYWESYSQHQQQVQQPVRRQYSPASQDDAYWGRQQNDTNLSVGERLKRITGE